MRQRRVEGLAQPHAQPVQLQSVQRLADLHARRRRGGVRERQEEVAERFLRAEGIRCTGSSLGGNQARRLQFWAVSGRARQMFVSNEEGAAVETQIRPQVLRPPADAGSVELF